MRRRAVLASALTAASTIAAGCSAVEPRTEHTDPAVKTENNPRDDGKYLEFHEDGVNLANVGVDPKFAPLPRNLGTWISHHEGTELRSLTQRVAAPGGDGTPPRLSLRGPLMGDSKPHPSVSLFQEGAAAVVEVHRFGELANETMFMGLSVTRWPESASRLVVGSTAELVETGLPDHTHVLKGQLEFDFTTESETSHETTETTGQPG